MGRMMVEIPVPPKWKQLWDIWDLRGFIILSLSLQTFLILFAPLRKRTKSNWIIMPLWSAYLLADWVANFAIGLISSSQGNPSDSLGKEGGGNALRNEDLLAFWAPFLLVHLGGPEPITAFALEDNELWRRHLLGLVFQCLATVYVFVLSLPQNRLWIPTVLMFMTGFIKYAERTRSFYLASVDRFKDSMRPNDNAELSTRMKRNREATKSANKTTKKGNLTELEVVQYAYEFFEKFKGLVIGVRFNRSELDQSQDFFLNRTAKDAFKVVEVELNFIYDVLYTKLPVVYSYFGAVSRSFSLATVCSAIVLFMFKNKSNLSSTDVTITYGLLFGALALDIIALFMLLFSDWTIISLRKSPDNELDKSTKTRILTAFLRLKTEGTVRDPKQDTRMSTSEPQTRRWPIRVLKRRWSESILTFNLMDYCLHPRSYIEQLVYENLGISGFLDDIKYVKTKKFIPELNDFIFNEIKLKLESAKKSFLQPVRKATEMYSPRGDSVLLKELPKETWGSCDSVLLKEHREETWGSLLHHVQTIDYGHSLLLWHIATELCYNNELKSKTPVKDHREMAKLLSDYMLYLLIMQPTMLLAVAGKGQIWFRGTCVEAKRVFEKVKVRKINKEQKRTPEAEDKEVDWEKIEACSEILAVKNELTPFLPRHGVNSLLYDGCVLAKMLEKIEEEDNRSDKWLIISGVWVELLCYGAIHSRANTHTAQMSRGGELITIVWLLMSHLVLDFQLEAKDDQE